MQSPAEKKECLTCGKPVHGRSDKKFCNDYCRNAYNNTLKSANAPVVRNINNVLQKNRRLLEEVLGEEEKLTVPGKKLLERGFQFKYATHTHTTKEGKVYVFCYDMGYLPLEGDWYLVVRRKE